MRNFLYQRRILRSMWRHLSYANVMATIAVFIALGGTSYAVATLPRNSVGAKQIRPGAVGKSEIRTGAIHSSDLHDRSVGLRAISRSARRALRGQAGPQGPAGAPGPPGVTLAAAVDSAGGIAHSVGGATGGRQGVGDYDVVFNRDLQACYAVGSLAHVDGGGTAVPSGGEIVTDPYDNGVRVHTRNSSGQPTDLPFHVIVSC
jgi:hypothetical protein